MFKRVIDSALSRARNDELRADGEAVKTVYGSLQSSVKQFRESGNINSIEAVELYNQAFSVRNVCI